MRMIRLLAAAVLLAAAAISPAPAGEEQEQDYDRLHADFKAAYESGDYDRALELAEPLYENTFMRHVMTLYDIAAIHCLKGDREEAYRWLEETLDAGFWDFGRLRRDESFACINQEKKFRTMTRAAWLKQYLAMLERPERAEFQKPEQVMQALAFREGERVADIGAGSGYFTIPVARAVGDEGVVWAIDIRQEMLDYIRERLEAEGLENVRLMRVEPDDPQLPNGKVDTILMVDMIHYVKDKAAYISRAKEGLAPGGRMVVIDYIPKPFEERPWGPPPVQQVSRETLDAAFAEAGMKPVRAHDFLTEQYFVEYAAE